MRHQAGGLETLGLVSFRGLRDIVRILLGSLRGHFEHLFFSFGDILSFRLSRGLRAGGTLLASCVDSSGTL